MDITICWQKSFCDCGEKINSLPPKCKQIFIMKFQKEFSNPEISRNLGLSLRTIENQLYIARGVLRKQTDRYLCS